MPRRADGTRFIGHQFTYFTPADWRDVSVVLKRKFPAIRFSHDPSFACVDRDEAEQMLRRVRPNWTSDYFQVPVEERTRTFVPEPQPAWRIVYTDAIEADPADAWTCAWIEPPGWSPFWRIGLADASPSLDNRPSLSFTVRHSSFDGGRRSTPNPRYARDEGTWIRLDGGAWHGSYLPFEDEVRRFLAQVRRIVLKHSTNAFSWVHYATHTVVERSPPGTMERVGFHAIEWARAHPDHWIGGSSDRDYIKPVDWELPGSS